MCSPHPISRLLSQDRFFYPRCQKPCLLLIGKEDFLYSDDQVETLRSVVSDSVSIEVLEGCDHFFREDEETIAQIIHGFVSTYAINMETI